ncbi:MAG: phospholipase D-like domain-containing protein [Desulfuromonadales bacterium]|nr:phospholipase D-like domain-containing protein [Desulfuromonadales bacterium]
MFSIVRMTLAILTITIATNSYATLVESNLPIGETTFATHFSEQNNFDSSHSALLIDMINRAPNDSQISIDVYHFDDERVANALVEASQRGVFVFVLTNDRDKNDRVWRILRDGLKEPFIAIHGQGGHAGTGDRSTTFGHNKISMFSKTTYVEDGVEHALEKVVVLSSGNFSKNGAKKYQATVVISNSSYYNLALKYLIAQARFYKNPRHNNPANAYAHTWPTDSPDAYTDRMYFFPKTGGGDPISNTLDPSEGVGVHTNHETASGRPTKIRIVTAKWSSPRRGIARVINRLVRAGNCEVEIIGRKKRNGTKLIDSEVRSALLNGLSSAQKEKVKFHWLEMFKDPESGDYMHSMHSKYMLFEGPWGNDEPQFESDDVRKVQWRNFVYHGTRNWTGSGLRSQDNMAIKISDDQVYSDFLHNFNYLKCNALGNCDLTQCKPGHCPDIE